MNTGSNPFKAPEARVADALPGDGEFIPDGRRVPVGNALSWLSRGWAIFRASPGTWIGLAVIFMVIAGVLTKASTITGMIFNLVAPVFTGGIMIGCHALEEEGGDLRIGHLFIGFSEHLGKLALVGLLYLIGLFAVGFIVGLTGVGAIMAGMTGMAGATHQIVWTTAIIAFLVALFLFVLLAMATWYAPALVVLHEVSPLQAMKSSFFACLKNIVPFLVYAVVVFILAILASLPFLLGWLVLMPMLFTSTYASYRDIFTEN